ncbi:MAG TPA: DinB family protein [Phototrophicaceae bacterium]|nr:DinB family protein [Phototrophicaceae bacterium]
MPIFTPDKALRDLPKTPVILSIILKDVTQQQAQTARDGADGWTVLEVMCHLNDYEQVFVERTHQIVESDYPHIENIDHLAWVSDHRYAEQQLADVFARYLSTRRAHLAFLRGLTPDQWQRKALSMLWGEITLVEHVTNITFHDVNHTEQIIKALGTSQIPAL